MFSLSKDHTIVHIIVPSSLPPLSHVIWIESRRRTESKRNSSTRRRSLFLSTPPPLLSPFPPLPRPIPPSGASLSSPPSPSIPRAASRFPLPSRRRLSRVGASSRRSPSSPPEDRRRHRRPAELCRKKMTLIFTRAQQLREGASERSCERWKARPTVHVPNSLDGS